MWAPNLTRKFIEQLVAENVTQEKNNEDSNSENCMLEEYNSEDARSQAKLGKNKNTEE